MRYFRILALTLGASLLLAACAQQVSTETEDTDATTETETEDADVDANTEENDATVVDPNMGLSTGEDTTVVETDRRGTLTDNVLGFQVTCPVDLTWKCKLNTDGTFSIQDLSSNKFEVRSHGSASQDNAIEAAMAIAEQKYEAYGVEVLEELDNGVILDIGPDPSWAVQVNRRVWISTVDVDGQMFTCEGFTSDNDYTENTYLDFSDMCASVVAAS